VRNDAAISPCATIPRPCWSSQRLRQAFERTVWNANGEATP
jgi:hypothetical protein